MTSSLTVLLLAILPTAAKPDLPAAIPLIVQTRDQAGLARREKIALEPAKTAIGGPA